ncbi:MAG: reductive dehalogenase, partial [Dehalogenimonas sp.]
MSIFHSTVSRRDFMKNLGLAGAGLGAAALVAPQFHDLDEMMASEKATVKRPWFVKERDLYDPTVEHDWDMINRYDRRWQAQTNRIKSYFSYYGDAEKRARLTAEGNAISDARTFQTPGYTLKSRALSEADVQRRAVAWSEEWTGPVDYARGDARTPEEFGTTKWTGTPEEASKMMNAATRYFGAALTGYAEFDDIWKNKMLVSYTTRGATKDWKATNGALPSDEDSLRYVFEDVDKGYATSSKHVYPSRKQLYIITAAGPAASQFLKAPNASLGYNSTSFPGPNGTGRLPANLIWMSTARFLRSLGYDFYSDTGHQSAPFNENAANQLTGINEQSRQQNYGLNPEYGNSLYPITMETDLPLAPTPPIDAGMWKFCKTCGFCAINCPAGCIESHKEPTWDIPTYEGKEVTFHNKGIKA